MKAQDAELTKHVAKRDVVMKYLGHWSKSHD